MNYVCVLKLCYAVISLVKLILNPMSYRWCEHHEVVKQNGGRPEGWRSADHQRWSAGLWRWTVDLWKHNNKVWKVRKGSNSGGNRRLRPLSGKRKFRIQRATFFMSLSERLTKYVSFSCMFALLGLSSRFLTAGFPSG